MGIFNKWRAPSPKLNNPSLSTIYEKAKKILPAETEESIRYLAAFSGLLGRVAYSDLEISRVEIEKIKKILTKTSSLSDTQIDGMVHIIQTEIEGLCGLENHIYVQELYELASKDQLEEILLALFLVAAADKTISPEENAELELISKSLGFTNQEFVEIRAHFAKFLSVFKEGED